jgi:hypothetical protein
MARTGFALGNPEGVEKGPVLVEEDTEIAAVEAAEQYGYGIVDVSLHFRNMDGSSIPGSPVSGWATGLAGNANYNGTVLIPSDEVFTGLVVIGEAGFGVVNFRIKKKKRADGSATQDSALIVPNENQNYVEEIQISAGATAEGVVVKVQNGYGIVDMAIQFKEPG